MVRYTLILSIALLATTSLSAQSWKKIAKEAGKMMSVGKYAEAGDLYMNAWKAKPKKKALAYKAGNAYYLVKDYNKAATALQVVKDNNKNFDKVGFKYAKCLKSLEQYDEASREFVFFINSYKGKDYEQVAQLVQTEILGCEMAIKKGDEVNENISVTHLSKNINSNKMEFAPLAYSEDILYFSSNKKGSSKIYRSQYLDGEWTRSQATETIFSDLEREHYGNVTFAPDNSRFYFTQCTVSPEEGAVCFIYMVESQADGNWSSPVALPEYINDPKSTNTHPNVVHIDGQEILYFTSNRNSGKGGMDIWYSTRDLGSSSLDFTFPKNLGAIINTPGDEITPFYDSETGILYFSSNGHIGYGGQDIYSTEGSETKWETPTNMERPINSAQDDRYFVFNSTPEEGFLVSNRKDGLDKITTTNEDIFQFGAAIAELVIKGKILTQQGEPVSDVDLTLYEVSANGQKRIITQQKASKKFKFPLIENKAYVLKASKAGFDAVNLEFEVPEDASSVKRDITLKSDNSITTPSPIDEDDEDMDMNEDEDVAISSSPRNRGSVSPRDMEDNEDDMDMNEDEDEDIVTSPQANTSTKPSISHPTTTHSGTSTTSPSSSHSTTSVPSSTSTPVTTSTSYPSTTNTSSYPTTTSTAATTSASYPTTTHSKPAKPSARDRSWYPNHGTTTAPVSSNSTAYPTTSTSSSSYSSTDYNVTTPYQPGVYYKVQMEAMKHYDASKYSPLSSYGVVEIEGVPEKSLLRILLGNFYNKQDAISARNEARSQGYERAYVVKYKDGQRVAIKVFYND